MVFARVSLNCGNFERSDIYFANFLVGPIFSQKTYGSDLAGSGNAHPHTRLRVTFAPSDIFVLPFCLAPHLYPTLHFCPALHFLIAGALVSWAIYTQR